MLWRTEISRYRPCKNKKSSSFVILNTKNQTKTKQKNPQKPSFSVSNIVIWTSVWETQGEKTTSGNLGAANEKILNLYFTIHFWWYLTPHILECWKLESHALWLRGSSATPAFDHLVLVASQQHLQLHNWELIQVTRVSFSLDWFFAPLHYMLTQMFPWA